MKTLDELLICYQPALLKECWKYYKQKADVWDLYQDAAVKMAAGFRRFNQDKTFLPWARRIILSAYSDQKRAKIREFGPEEPALLSGHAIRESVEPTVGEPVTLLLNLLTKDDATLLRSVYSEQQSQSQVARKLGVSQQTISKRVDKAKQRLKEVYNEFFN